MRIRSIRMHNDPYLEDISIELSTRDGVRDVVLIKGDNGSGKSLLLSCANFAFVQSVLPPQKRLDLQSGFSPKLMSVEFEIGSQIHSVHIRNGYAEPNASLGKLVAPYLEPRAGKIRDVLISYFPGRSSWAAALPNANQIQEGGVASILPIVSDLLEKDFENCVIMIDDVDMGLSPRNQLVFWKYLQEQASSRNSQLICTCRSPTIASKMPANSVIELSGGFDILNMCREISISETRRN